MCGYSGEKKNYYQKSYFPRIRQTYMRQAVRLVEHFILPLVVKENMNLYIATNLRRINHSS